MRSAASSALVLLLMAGVCKCSEGLEGLTLTAVAASPGQGQQSDEWGAAYVEIWNCVAATLNFTLRVRTLEAPLPEVGWSALLQEVRNGTAHLSLTPVIELPSTAINISFSTPVHGVRFSVLLRGGAGDRVRWSGFLAPFERPLWLALLGCLTVLALALALSWGLERPQPKPPLALQASEALLCVLGSACLQGHPSPPRGPSARLVHLTWLVASVIVAAVYSSSVTAYLAVTREERPFSTLDQLLGHSRYAPVTLAGSPEHHVFKESQHPALARLRSSSRAAPPTLPSLSTALGVVCGRNSSLLGAWRGRTPALVLSSLLAERALAAAPCRLAHFPLNDPASPRLWAAFPLATKLRNHRQAINRALLLLHEGGALVRYAEEILLRTQLAREVREAEGAARAPRFTVSMRDFAPLIGLLGCGGGLALLLLAIEVALGRLLAARADRVISFIN